MGAIFLIVVVVVGAAAWELTSETAGEFFAMYLIEPIDFGASSRVSPNYAAQPPQAIIEGDAVNVLLAAVAPNQTVDGAVTMSVGIAGVNLTAAEQSPSTDLAAPARDASQEVSAMSPEIPEATGFDSASESEGDFAAASILALIGDTPHRQLDGSVFIPISTQWVFGLRTVLGERARAPLTAELPGRIVINPGSATLVQVSNEGFIESISGGYPFVGQAVKRGQLLAYLRPVNDHLEQAQHQERIQQLINEIDLDRKRMARLEEVIYVRYRGSKIEALRVEIRGLQRQLEILQNALDVRYELRAKTDGIVSRVEAQIGEYMHQGETVFEVVDPTRLWVEANAFDLDSVAEIDSASAFTVDGRVIKLRFIGGGLRLSQQATPLRFEIVDVPPDLTVDNPVTVVISNHATMVEGVKIPRRSIQRTSDGRQIVWVRRSAERFVAHHISARSIDSDTMLVTSGLAPGVRVVTTGAAVLDQVR